MLVVLGCYLLVWALYGVIAKSSQDLHPDMTELIAWSRDLALGFPKHPPFAAIVVRGWFALFPVADWAFYLLAMATATIGLWIAWQLFEDYLDPTKRLIALALLTFVPFYNFHALKFNVNTVLIPLWTVTTFWFLRSYRTLDPVYAAATGIAAAFCMLSKYWSIFLLAGLVVAALSDGRRAAYFRSAAPWITAVVTIAVLSPHIGWLEKNNFSPVEYAMSVHGWHSTSGVLRADFRYLTDSFAFVAAPIAIVLLAARPSLKTTIEMLWPRDPERRLVAVVIGSTLLLPMIPALFWGVEIHGIWSMSSWTLLPVLLLSSPSVQLSHLSVRYVVGIGIAFPVMMLLLAPAVALAVHLAGIPPEQAQARMLAGRVERVWDEATTKPLRYVGGDLADAVLTYAKSRPELLPGFPEWHQKRVIENGIAFACFSEQTACITSSSSIANGNFASRKFDIELTRNFLGFPGESQRYVIFIIPPR